MKRFLVFLMTVFLSFVFFNCGDSGGSDPDPDTRIIIKGIAAIGAVLPPGARVEIRGQATTTPPVASMIKAEETLYPSQVITTEVDGGGYYEADVSSLTPPYLIRAYNPGDGNWYYSFSTESGTANINPFTSYIVRGYYMGNNVLTGMSGLEVNVLFSTGVYPSGTISQINGGDVNIIPDNTPFAMPDATAFNNVKTCFANMLKRAYNVQDAEDFLTGVWNLGLGWDYLLDSDADNNSFSQFMIFQPRVLFATPDYFYDGLIKIYLQPIPGSTVCTKVEIEIWTKLNTITAKVTNGNYNANMILIDEVAGIKHFKYNAIIGGDPEGFLPAFNGHPSIYDIFTNNYISFTFDAPNDYPKFGSIMYRCYEN